MTNSVFRTAGVIGTGMMGPGIAATLALGGVETAIVSRAAETAMRGLEMALDIDPTSHPAWERRYAAVCPTVRPTLRWSSSRNRASRPPSTSSR